MTVVIKCLAMLYTTMGCPGILVVWFDYALLKERGREREERRQGGGGRERERERERESKQM
jgi:hypothetical protein